MMNARDKRGAIAASAGNHALAIQIASIPDDIRGYGHVKDKSVEAAEKKLAALMARWHAPTHESQTFRSKVRSCSRSIVLRSLWFGVREAP